MNTPHFHPTKDFISDVGRAKCENGAKRDFHTSEPRNLYRSTPSAQDGETVNGSNLRTTSRSGTGGFIRTIILIIIALVALSLAGVDVAGILNAEEVRETLRKTWQTSLSLYRDYILPAWTNYIKDGLLLIWTQLIDGVLLDNLKDIVRPSGG